MSTETPTTPELAAASITPHIARLVLTQFRSGPSGMWLAYPSSGEMAVLDALCSVDAGLLDCMTIGLPGLGDAIRLIRTRGGSEALQAIARGDGQP